MSKLVFPENFVWGTATASYQIEGGVREGGRAPSIWDAVCYTPGRVLHGHNADMACDHFHRFKEDIALMKELGLKAYRFSLAWPRIIPAGFGDVNEQGVAFYSELIDCLLDAGITPWVTLYHWDLPLVLQTEFDGLINPEFPDWFAAYADVCFDRFGDRVKNWITLNEPWCSAVLGYGIGVHAPCRKLDTAEAYMAAHQLLRGHGKAVQLYRNKYQSQAGSIGITNNCDWREPLTDSDADKAASQRSLEFFLGWFCDPVYKGDYPQVMRDMVGDRLPRFTDADKAMIKGSSDFFGLNHYTTMLASEPTDQVVERNIAGNGGISEDQNVTLTEDPSWQKTDMDWNVVPWGSAKLLKWIDERYDHPPIYVTENGCAYDVPVVDGVCDDLQRLDFFKSYLTAMHGAIEDGVDLRGYFAWSFMDNFEWAWGYTKRFGLVHTDYTTQQRIVKNSMKWYSQVVQSNAIAE